MNPRLLILSALLLSTAPASAEEYLLWEDVPYRDSSYEGWDDYVEERCRLDLYYPKGMTNYYTVVWIHGGGLMGGSKEIPEELMEKGIAVVAINYRLHPMVKCPTYIEDAAAATAWVFEHIGEYGGDPQKIIVAGHSAGGYLTSMLCLDKQYLAAYGIDADNVATYVPLSGQCITHSTVRRERNIPRTQPIIDEFAPAYHVRKDAPPILLVTGDRDLEMPARFEENAYLASLLKQVKHPGTVLYEVEGFGHGGMGAPGRLILLQRIRDLEKKEE